MSFKRKNGQAPAKKDYTKLKTPHTYAIIFFVVIVCWLLTFLIPAGKFSTHTIEYTDSDGGTASRTVLMADTFRYYYNLDTDFVADALAEISQDAAVMEEWEVDAEALAALMETDSSAWTQEDLDAVGISDDEMYSRYGEEFYDTSKKLHKTAGVWGTQDFGGFGFMNYVFEGLVTGDRSGSAVGLCALILVIGGSFGRSSGWPGWTRPCTPSGAPCISPAGAGSCACCPWRRWPTTCFSSGRTSWSASAG